MNIIAIWYLIFSVGNGSAVVPMQSKQACYAALKTMGFGEQPYKCVNAETGEVLK